MIESNRPINQVHRSSDNGLMNGMMWGAVRGAGVAGAYSAANQYALKGDISKMGKYDSFIPKGVEHWRRGEQEARATLLKNELNRNGEKVAAKEANLISRTMYNTTFGHGMKGNARRVGVSAAIGAVMGGFHSSSDGIIG